MEDFRAVPFIMHPHPSRLRKTIDEIAIAKHFEIDISLQTNSTEILPRLCRYGMGACIVSQMFFPAVHNINGSSHKNEYIHIFPINDLADVKGELYISFIRHKYIPSFQKNFIKMTREIFQSLQSECNE